jgi:hypothetical protein
MWTDERKALLRKLRADGLPYSRIAAELGGVTRNAAISKARRMGIGPNAVEGEPMSGLMLVHDAQADPAEKLKPLQMKPKRSPWTPKPRPADRSRIDGRLAAAKLFDRAVNDVIAEMGGDVSRIERGLIEGWVGAHVGLQGLIAKVSRLIGRSMPARSVSWSGRRRSFSPGGDSKM